MKKILALLLAAVLVLGMAACAASPAAPTQTTSDTASDASDTPASNAETPAASSGAKLRFVTGGESGTYYAFGSVIAQHATNNAGVDIVGLVGNGSQSNIFELEDGNAELAFCQSDVMAYAYDGTNLFADTGAVSCFSTVAALYTEQVQIVTTDPSLKTVEDLRGKRVCVGDVGSGTYFNAIDVFAAYDMTIDDVSPVYQSFGDSTESLKDGKIDAGFVVAGAPTTAVTDLATTKDTYLVSLDSEHIAKLLETSDVTPSPGGFIWPVSTSKIITSPMGGRVSPGGIGSTNHRGVDIGGVGTTSAVMATKSGKVVLTRVVVYGSYGGSGYGNYVVVDHGGGYTTLYAHMTSISVSEGQMVAQGDTLGITGSTGNSTGPHLHYEVMIKGVNQNPLDYLPGYIARW